jgi:hypothetical protein
MPTNFSLKKNLLHDSLKPKEKKIIQEGKLWKNLLMNNEGIQAQN